MRLGMSGQQDSCSCLRRWLAVPGVSDHMPFFPGPGCLRPGKGGVKARFHVGDAPMDVQAAVGGGAQVGTGQPWEAARDGACTQDVAARPAAPTPAPACRCARACRLPPAPQAVGVCTGIYTRQELVDAAPEAVVLDDLTDLQRVLATFGLD